MSLNWRTADVELTTPLVPNPNSESNLLDRLLNVRVAVESGFLHIDPRQVGQPTMPGQDTYTVTVVPAHLVTRITYKAEIRKDQPIDVQVY